MDLNTLIIPFIFLLLLFMTISAAESSNGCSISKCSGGDSTAPDIRFPFQVHDSGQPESCGYSGFEVSCRGSLKQTLIELPSSGDFIIKSIDYAAQELWVNDPDNCLPKRLLSLNLSGSPFSGVYYQDFTFFNCSSSLSSTKNNIAPHLDIDGLIGPISCLSGSHSFVYAIPIMNNNNVTSSNNITTSHGCSTMALAVRVPVQWPMSLRNQTGSVSSSLDLGEDLRLTWFGPECRQCESKGQMCGLKVTNSSTNGADQQESSTIICSNMPNQGNSGKLPVSTFIGIILIICAPSMVCLVGSLWLWIRARYRASPTPPLQLTQSIITPRPGHLIQLGIEEAGVEFARQVALMGLDEEAGPEFEPKIVLSEIEEMGPNRENVCSICMCEYRPKDKIGTIPTCGHYFHSDCINKWLTTRGIIGRTCPICRARVDS